MCREDRGGGLITPFCSHSPEDLDSMGYPTPAPSSPGGRCFGLVFSLPFPGPSHWRHVLPPASSRPWADWHPEVHCGCP
jgi:hypothetical protein